MTSRIYRVWEQRIICEPIWGHGKIRQFCHTVYSLSEYGIASGHYSNLTQDEATDLMTMFWFKYPDRFAGPLVTDEQAEIGRNWLATKGIKLGLRKDVNWRDITHFRFVGMFGYDSGYRPYCTPIYAGFLPNGDVIRYNATPWQAFEDFNYQLHEGANA